MTGNKVNAPLRELLASSEEAADFMADAKKFPDRRLRREFLRQLAFGTVAIPTIGVISEAKEKKAEKAKEKAPTEASKAKASEAKHASTSERTRSKARANAKASGGVSHASRPDAQAQSRGSMGADPDAKRGFGGKPLPDLYKKWNLRNFETIQTDENAHVSFLVNALGNQARPMPVFQNLEQTNVHDFAVTARALENTGVGAYLGALPILASTAAGISFIPAAGSIALIEGRHAGYLNSLLDLSLIEDAVGDVSSFEVPLTAQQVVNLASPFIASLNGGPPLIPAGGLSSPIDVLNFALALEFLESSYYDINVPNLMKVLGQ